MYNFDYLTSIHQSQNQISHSENLVIYTQVFLSVKLGLNQFVDSSQTSLIFSDVGDIHQW